MINGNACFAYFNKNWGIPPIVLPYVSATRLFRPNAKRESTAANCQNALITAIKP